jgi:hypothetical protein
LYHSRTSFAVSGKRFGSPLPGIRLIGTHQQYEQL